MVGQGCWIGTSGWVYPHWRGLFYPEDLREADWFLHYAREFPCVEVNYSFYRLPAPATIEAWCRTAPPGFLFAVKASRYLTHVKRLKDCAGPLARFLDVVRPLGAHLGPVLYQLPPRWRPDPERLRDFLTLLPAELRHAVELRDPRWFTDPVREMLAARGVAFCIHDWAGSACPPWVTAPLVYVRLHGSRHGPGGRYTAGELSWWAAEIGRWLRDGLPVHVYFNNDAFGHAIANARELTRLVGSRAAASLPDSG